MLKDLFVLASFYAIISLFGHYDIPYALFSYLEHFKGMRSTMVKRIVIEIREKITACYKFSNNFGKASFSSKYISSIKRIRLKIIKVM